jgi:GcrA cell cycle regulator
MVWDEETIRLLREFWAEGLSTAEIGRRLGTSKNAIVGKAHRLDLQARPSPIRREPPKLVTVGGKTVTDGSHATLPPLPSTVASNMVATDSAELGTAAPGAASTPASPPLRIVPPQPRPASLADSGTAPGGASRPTQAATPGTSAAPSLPPSPGTQAGSAGAPAPARSTPASPVAPSVSSAALSSASFQVRRTSVACCWPIGEPGTKGFRFCDEVSVPGKPYCEEHVKLAYVRIRDRKEDAA